MADDKRSDRELIREALTELQCFNEIDKPLSKALGGLIGCAYAAGDSETMDDGEALEGAIICLMGMAGKRSIEIVGAINPTEAYGILIEAIFKVYEAMGVDEAKTALKTFVGNAAASLASIEKEITKPDEH